jgi:hypothetical protein
VFHKQIVDWLGMRVYIISPAAAMIRMRNAEGGILVWAAKTAFLHRLPRAARNLRLPSCNPPGLARPPSSIFRPLCLFLAPLRPCVRFHLGILLSKNNFEWIFWKKGRILELLEAADAKLVLETVWGSSREARWHSSRLAQLEQRNISSYDQIVRSHYRSCLQSQTSLP